LIWKEASVSQCVSGCVCSERCYQDSLVDAGMRRRTSCSWLRQAVSSCNGGSNCASRGKLGQPARQSGDKDNWTSSPRFSITSILPLCCIPSEHFIAVQARTVVQQRSRPLPTNLSKCYNIRFILEVPWFILHVVYSTCIVVFTGAC
jgi:hypothetical protein